MAPAVAQAVEIGGPLQRADVFGDRLRVVAPLEAWPEFDHPVGAAFGRETPQEILLGVRAIRDRPHHPLAGRREEEIRIERALRPGAPKRTHPAIEPRFEPAGRDRAVAETRVEDAVDRGAPRDLQRRAHVRGADPEHDHRRAERPERPRQDLGVGDGARVDEERHDPGVGRCARGHQLFAQDGQRTRSEVHLGVAHEDDRTPGLRGAPPQGPHRVDHLRVDRGEERRRDGVVGEDREQVEASQRELEQGEEEHGREQPASSRVHIHVPRRLAEGPRAREPGAAERPRSTGAAAIG